MENIFDQQLKELIIKEAPLADRMRPLDFAEFVGQEEIISPDKPLRKSIEKDTLYSVILWGPPGSGKTTLANIIANKTKSYFQPFSPITSGVAELREIIKIARDRRRLKKQKTILFVDEIHHFNKSQQNVFLPFIENGTILLVGATTENPSFELIPPLLSRSLVLVLNPLKNEEVEKIILNAIKDRERGFGNLKIRINRGTIKALVSYANGDARLGLNALELVVLHTAPDDNNIIQINEQVLKEALQKKILRYDKKGEEHYNIISAFIKSMRDSHQDAALYWLARMLDAGENPRFIARRMLIFASEDIGNADPMALLIAQAVAYAVEQVGMPEAQLNLAQGTIYLAQAPKDNSVLSGLGKAMSDVKEYGNLPVPMHLRNAVTKLLREIGYGKGYIYPHTDDNRSGPQDDLPVELKNRKYLEEVPSQFKEEQVED
ncbi:MAG: Replication-associated recombination protein A [candidate division WS2 bacterium]|nr:Replication-associated recombination protein A [Candidatus Lithacetigena glycinireducens]